MLIEALLPVTLWSATAVEVRTQTDCRCMSCTIMCWICREDATGAALCLLEVGASVDPVDGAGRTALHAAAEVGSATVSASLFLLTPPGLVIASISL